MPLEQLGKIIDERVQDYGQRSWIFSGILNRVVWLCIPPSLLIKPIGSCNCLCVLKTGYLPQALKNQGVGIIYIVLLIPLFKDE